MMESRRTQFRLTLYIIFLPIHEKRRNKHKFVNIEIEVHYGENEETDLWKTSTISNRTSYDSMNETW